jgi:hypothetical protein
MVSLVSRGVVGDPTQRPGPRDATGPEESLDAVRAWRGSGQAGRVGREGSKKRALPKEGRARWGRISLDTM